MRWLNAATDELDATIRARTRAAGFRYVAPVAEFRDHAWCDDDAWVNGPSRPVVNSYHPKLAGHAAYAGVVGPALLGGRYAGADPGTAAPVRLAPGLRGRATTSSACQTSARPLWCGRRRGGVRTSELTRLRRAQREAPRPDPGPAGGRATRRAPPAGGAVPDDQSGRSTTADELPVPVKLPVHPWPRKVRLASPVSPVTV